MLDEMPFSKRRRLAKGNELTHCTMKWEVSYCINKIKKTVVYFEFDEISYFPFDGFSVKISHNISNSSFFQYSNSKSTVFVFDMIFIYFPLHFFFKKK